MQNDILRTTTAAGFGFALIQLDVTVVNVALPTIAHVLEASISGLQWVVDSYALSLAALLISAGYIGDRFGAKRTYLWGLAIFAFASLGCGLAKAAAMLVMSRIIQGVGAAAMLPSSLALINHAAQGHSRRRATAVGWWTAAGAVAIAAGPILGGLLLGTFGWRSIFLANLPLCFVGIWLTAKVRETERIQGALGFDVHGQILAVLAVGGLTAAVIEARPQGLTPFTLCVAAVGIIATAAFILQEQHSKSPMLPMSFFGVRTFSCAVGYGAIVNFTYYGIVFVLSLYLQRALHYDPIAAGLAFLPLTATFFVANLLSGWWVGRAGSRAPMIVGALIDAIGFAVLTAVAGRAAPYWKLAISFVLIPLGMGLGVPAMTASVLAGSAQERSGTASAVLNSARQAAGAMGVALFGAFAGEAPAHIVTGLQVSSLVAVGMLLGAMFLGWAAVPKKRTAVT